MISRESQNKKTLLLKRLISPFFDYPRMTIMVYDSHLDAIPINWSLKNQGEEKFFRSDGEYGLSIFVIGAVYPLINVTEEIAKLFNEGKLDRTIIPRIIYDQRSEISPLKLSKRTACFSALGGLTPLNHAKANNNVGSDESIDNFQVSQIHIDPDFFSDEGITRVFGREFDYRKFFYNCFLGKGTNDGRVVSHALRKYGDSLELLGLFEFYAHKAEGREKEDVEAAVKNVLDVSGFSPDHLAIDPQILNNIPNLEDLAKKIVVLPGYKSPEDDRFYLDAEKPEEPALHEMSKVLVMAESHRSAMMAIPLEGFKRTKSELEQMFGVYEEIYKPVHAHIPGHEPW